MRTISGLIPIIVALLCLAGFVDTFASSESDSTSSANPAVGYLILLIICVLRRKKPIGGWLLLFLMQTVIELIMIFVFTLPNISQYNPSIWQSKIAYFSYLFSTIPDYILAFAVAIIIVPGSFEKFREWSVIIRLRKMLWLRLVAVTIAIVIDIIYWPENVALDIVSSVWIPIWIAYFYKSERVKRVYCSDKFDRGLHNTTEQQTGKLEDDTGMNNIKDIEDYEEDEWNQSWD